MQRTHVFPWRNRTGYAKVAVGGAFALLLFLTWFQFIRAIFWPTAIEDEWRRPAIWVAARMAVEGQGDLIYSPQPFHDESIRLGAVPDIFDANAPTAIIPYLPVAGLSVGAARTVWLFFSLASFLAAWALLLRALRLPLLIALALSAIVPFFQPWRYGIYVGQAYSSVLLFAVAGALFAVRAEQPGAKDGQRKRGGIVSGCAFALTATIRHYYGAIFLLPSLIKRQWLVVAASLAIFGAGAALTLALVGGDAWGTSLRLAWTWRERPETAVTAYQSVNNFLTHLFRYDPTWNSAPIVDATTLIGPLYWVATLALFALSVLALWRSRTPPPETTTAQRLLPYALATPLALLVSPISEDYHYTLTLFPLVVAAVVLFQWHQSKPLPEGDRGFRISGTAIGALVLAVSLVLLGAPWRYYNVPVGPGLGALLYYPRLYGNLLLWGLVLALLWRAPRSPQRATASLLLTHPPA